MVGVHPVAVLLSAAGVLVVISTLPYGAVAIEYRRRDNGLAYLLFVTGVGVWNAMVVVQLLSAEPIVKVFFLALSVVGAVLGGLGWFLFATTASATATVFDRADVYGTVAVLGGIDIALAVTAPLHSVYWNVGGAYGRSLGFAAVEPAVGYWLHTALLVGLFGAGTVLFADAWRGRIIARYSRIYTVVGAGTVVAIVGSNVFSPGGLGVAPLVAAGLTTVGWLQATRGRLLDRLRFLR